ncbi:MAG: hypothetical protein A2698_00670 [Candidatus Levybacteria bacterium RIFCSPHIGHO2_01_FULL_42_15]|nr:MAG: hypothetical protein A2698_00670 [Candidatus Levybacteria bacterium RIFCSPHIGHO2_01_FULL_42_15]OGH42764.1 MAG: hypothetical protein A3B53_01465 [Candidatus Levybacteria bacterium RIFCSPLOWO2_01_FULL_42_15]
MKKKNWTSGFTIVELLLYMGIFAILLIVLFQIFTSIIDVQLESGATASVAQDGRFLLVRLAYDISQAQAVTNPSSLGAQASSLQVTINGTTLTYSVTDGILNLTNGSTNITNALTSIDTTISNLRFTRLGNPAGKDTVQVAFTLRSRTVKQGGTESQVFQTTVGLR